MAHQNCNDCYLALIERQWLTNHYVSGWSLLQRDQRPTLMLVLVTDHECPKFNYHSRGQDASDHPRWKHADINSQPVMSYGTMTRPSYMVIKTYLTIGCQLRESNHRYKHNLLKKFWPVHDKLVVYNNLFLINDQCWTLYISQQRYAVIREKTDYESSWRRLPSEVRLPVESLRVTPTPLY